MLKMLDWVLLRLRYPSINQYDWMPTIHLVPLKWSVWTSHKIHQIEDERAGLC